MHSRNRWLLATAIVALVFSGGVAMAESSGDVNVWFGQKNLEEDEWSPVEDQTQYGVMINFGGVDWPVAIAVDLFQSSDDTSLDYGYYYYGYYIEAESIEGKTTEFDIGVRKIWDGNPQFKPYVGGGVAWVSGEFELVGTIFDKQFGDFRVSDDDTGIGIWVNGGVTWRVTEAFNLGLDLRYSTADVDVFGVDVDAGGTQYGVFGGFHW